MRLRFVGLMLAILGIFLVLVTVPRFTGFVVLGDSSLRVSVQVIGLILFIGGIFLMISQKEDLESQVDVYDDRVRKGLKGKERTHYFLVDSERSVSNEGRVSLGEFERQIASYRKDKEGSEYVEVIRSTYALGLHKIVARGGEKAEIARAFLNVLEGSEEKQEEDTSISFDEKREIKNAFRGWNGTPNREQLEVCRKYGINYEHGSNSGKFRLGHYSRPVSLTPSHEASSGITRDLANMIRESREEDKKKKAS